MAPWLRKPAWPRGSAREDASPLLHGGGNAAADSAPAARFGPTAVAVTAPAKPSRLRNVSGFDLPPAPEPGASAVAPAAGGMVAGSIAAGFAAFWSNGMALAVVAYAVFSISSFSVKLTHGRVPVLELCLVRSSCSFVLSAVVMRAAHVAPMFGQRVSWPLLVCRGATGAFSMALYYLSLQLLPLGDAMTIGLIQPPLTAVLARLVLGEPLGGRGAVGCLVSLSGIVLVCQPPFLFRAAAVAGGDGGMAASVSRALGSAAGVTAAALSSLSYLAIRRLGAREPAPVVAMAFHTATLALAAGPVLAGWPQRARLPSPRDMGLLLGVAVTSFTGQLLVTRALQCTAAARVSAASFTQVVYSFALSFAFFHDHLTAITAGGVLCTLCGVALVVLRHGPTPQPQQPLLVAKASSTATTSKSPPSHDPMVAAGTAIPGVAAAEGRAAPTSGPSMAPQRSLRALESFRRFSAELSLPATMPLSAARSLLRNLSLAAAAHLEQQPSLSAAELAVAAEGACAASTALLVTAAAAYDVFAGAASQGDGARSTGSAADVVAAAFGEDAPPGDSSAAFIPAARGNADALLAEPPIVRDDASTAAPAAAALQEQGGALGVEAARREPGSPRMSSQLPTSPDHGGDGSEVEGCPRVGSGECG